MMTDILTGAAAVYTVASIITRLTPTKKDDEILTKLGTISKFWKIIFEATRRK
jgi:hypothetical protein